MKIKLFFLAILILLALVGYKTYSETQTLKSINSYESCVASKGSIIQTSYPATCITRLGSRFTQSIPIQIEVYRNDNKVTIKNTMEFKLPVGWEYSVCSGGTGILGIIVLGAPKQSPTCPLDGISGAIEIIFSKYITPITTVDMGFEVSQKTNINLDGINAIKQTEKAIDGALTGIKFTSVYINKDNAHITITLNDENEQKALGQILSSFHFLD